MNRDHVFELQNPSLSMLLFTTIHKRIYFILFFKENHISSIYHKIFNFFVKICNYHEFLKKCDENSYQIQNTFKNLKFSP